jgi:hypothetical protein
MLPFYEWSILQVAATERRSLLRYRDNAGFDPAAESVGVVYDVLINVGREFLSTSRMRGCGQSAGEIMKSAANTAASGIRKVVPGYSAL